jgi:LysR family transcriptional regulator, glycine cleavage system transcriptional activator
VIALEDHIGAQLFIRHPGGLILTVEGGNLKEAIKPAFELLNEAFTRYARRPPRSAVVRISTLPSFAAQFLVPRLAAFRAEHPDIEIEFLTSLRLVDFSREDIDLGVRYGAGGWDGAMSYKLVDNVLVPVCLPSLLARAGGDAARLLKQTRRIQHTSFNEWRAWSELTGVDLSGLSPPIMIEDFLVALRALMLGEGIALMPEILVRDHLSAGELAPFHAVGAPADYSYHVAFGTRAQRRPEVRAVIEWLRKAAAA